MTYIRLGDLLISAGIINEKELSEALAVQKKTGERLGDVLLNNNVITEPQLIEALQIQLGVDFVDLTSVTIPVELTKYVPRNIAKKYSTVPVKIVSNELYVAMIDPMNFMALEEIKNVSHKNVIPLISTRAATERAINTLYGSEGAARAIEEMKREAENTPESSAAVKTVVGEEEDSAAVPTIRFVNSVIERAVVERASDIHIEPQEKDMVVRMRIDGLLRTMLTVPAKLQNPVISRLKIMGNMDISEHKIPQDGRANVNVKGKSIDLRISSLPTSHGEKMVLRLLDKSEQFLDKGVIGLEGDDLKKYAALMKNSSGVILIVGPTGSGKSTTMSTMIKEIAREDVNVVTLEDPVEIEIPGVNQCQINEKTGMTFASGLRSILRQDPDIIAVGEIRDGETGTIAMRAAITGHLVLSTIHTNDAVSTIDRLVDIGIEPYLISSALKGVISQRLIRKICTNCREAYHPSDEELSFFGLKDDGSATFYRGAGCPECSHTGYLGRQAVFEILVLNREEKSLINQRANHDEIAQAVRRTNFVSMRENCRSLVLRGVTTTQEVFKVINSTEE